jgi:hypothetical protein
VACANRGVKSQRTHRCDLLINHSRGMAD